LYNEELCIFCDKCENICPPGAIKFEVIDLQSGKKEYNYNPYLCIYCGACVDACPKSEEGCLIQSNSRTPVMGESVIKDKKLGYFINKVDNDYLSQSLFSTINNSNSNINILIGSKKFIEGWNSWRVSNMGLINMGKKEGPQIIQLFGRGVRLKGKDFSLKREENSDYKLNALQTLYIFGLNADYMRTFIKTIEKEHCLLEIEKCLELNTLKPNRKPLASLYAIMYPKKPYNLEHDDFKEIKDKLIDLFKGIK
jgi:ferredoxin